MPFVDLEPMHRDLRASLLDDIGAIVASGAFANGPHVSHFESEFAGYCGRASCIGLASGLDALRLGLLALEIGPGGQVVVPAQTFVATWEAVSQTGATPVAADISEEDYALDPAAAEAACGPSTRAILPVHLYGQMADMPALEQVAARRGLVLVEDACQAHGAQRDGVRPGDRAACAAFSFYPAKNLGAFGDAGALTTDDAGLDGRVRALREHGQTAKYIHGHVGYTSRLDTIQAAVLLRKLERLDGWNAERRAAAQRYSAELGGAGDLRVPPVAPGSEHVWHLYVVRTADPGALAQHLATRGIASGRHYPEPPHLSRAYADLGYRAGAFPVAEALAREALSLPLYPGITEAQLEAVIEGVRSFFDGR